MREGETVNEEDESSGDLYRCGVCGQIEEYDFGLLPCEDKLHEQFIACPDCRQRYGLIELADHYDENQPYQLYEFPFRVDNIVWIDQEFVVGSLLEELLRGSERRERF